MGRSITNFTLLDKSVYLKIFFFLNKNVCCGYAQNNHLNETSFEPPKQKLKLMNKEYSQFHVEKFKAL